MSHILRHHEGNARNSEGAFVRLNNGDLYFAYSRYNSEKCSDHASSDIAAVISKDNGESWSEPFIVVKKRKLNTMSVSLLRLQDGRIAMVYLEKSSIPGWENYVDCRPKIIFSNDEARSWSEPVEIAHVPPTYFVVNNDRLVQLKNGRLLLPASHHPHMYRLSSDGIIRFFISDDNGVSWRMGKECIYPVPRMPVRGFMEPGVVELEDGRVMCFIRTAAGCQYKSYSYDSGETWSPAVPAMEFPSPEAPMSIKRDPESGKLYAIWNDYTPMRAVRVKNPSWDRNPLVMAESSDEGATWENHQILEEEPDHGYCYIAMLFHAGKLFLGYCCGGMEDCQACVQDIKLRTLILR